MNEGVNYRKQLSKYDYELKKLEYEVKKMEIKREMLGEVKEIATVIAPVLIEVFNGLQTVLNNYMKLKGYELELQNLKHIREVNLRKFEKTVDFLMSLNDATVKIMENISKIEDEEVRKIFIERFLHFSNLLSDITRKLINSL